MTDLELVMRDDLIEELARRYETIVVGLHKPRGDGTSNRMLWFKGNPFIAQGLAAELSHTIHEQITESSEIDPDQTESGER